MRGLRPRRRSTAEAAPASGDLPGVVLRLIDGTPLDARARAGLIRRLSVALATSARWAGIAAVASGRWLADVVEEFAPHVPVRDLPALRAHHGGLAGDALARALIDTAARATGAVGAAVGVVASIEFTAPPMLLGAPVQIAAETIAVVAIELKLIAELHEVYGGAVVGTPAVRTAAYLGAWTRRRGVNPMSGGPALPGLLGGTARRGAAASIVAPCGREQRERRSVHGRGVRERVAELA